MYWYLCIVKCKKQTPSALTWVGDTERKIIYIVHCTAHLATLVLFEPRHYAAERTPGNSRILSSETHTFPTDATRNIRSFVTNTYCDRKILYSSQSLLPTIGYFLATRKLFQQIHLNSHIHIFHTATAQKTCAENMQKWHECVHIGKPHFPPHTPMLHINCYVTKITLFLQNKATFFLYVQST